jgi:hypothetical protein
MWIRQDDRCAAAEHDLVFGASLWPSKAETAESGYQLAPLDRPDSHLSNFAGSEPYSVNGGDRNAMRESEYQPRLQSIFQFFAAPLQSFGVRPQSFESWNVAVVARIIFNDFVLRPPHGRLDVLGQHGIFILRPRPAFGLALEILPSPRAAEPFPSIHDHFAAG